VQTVSAQKQIGMVHGDAGINTHYCTKLSLKFLFFIHIY